MERAVNAFNGTEAVELPVLAEQYLLELAPIAGRTRQFPKSGRGARAYIRLSQSVATRVKKWLSFMHCKTGKAGETVMEKSKETGCPYRELYPVVMMMKAADDRPSGDLAKSLNRPMARRVLAQGQMCSEPVVTAGVGCKDSAQMGLAEDDSVIKAFPPDRADQSLGMAVLPG
jgi:hypothetical protein